MFEETGDAMKSQGWPALILDAAVHALGIKPMGYDDPNAGWKGRGLWSTYGTRAPAAP